MKKLLVLLALALTFTGCEKKDDECLCKGAFLLQNTDRPFFAVVDCETGAPTINNYANFEIEYLGCVD